MPEIVGQDNVVHFGAVDAPPVDWRQTPAPEDPDDDLLPVTPPDVVALLGFDPLEFDLGEKDFDPHQPRDESGRWSPTGGSGGDLSDEFVHEVKAAVASIDKVIRDKLGVKVRAVKSVKDAYPELEGVKPRGWFSGKWEEAAGLYDPEKAQVVVAEMHMEDGELVKSDRTPGVTRHEYGHAVDRELGRILKMGLISNSGAFDEAYGHDVNTLLKQTGSQIVHNGYSFQGEAANLSYFIQPEGGKRTSAGRSEAFAEAFATLYGGGCCPEDFAKHFPRTIRHVADKLKELETSQKADITIPTPAAAKSGDWFKAGVLDIMRAEGPGGIVGDIIGK